MNSTWNQSQAGDPSGPCRAAHSPTPAGARLRCFECGDHLGGGGRGWTAERALVKGGLGLGEQSQVLEKGLEGKAAVRWQGEEGGFAASFQEQDSA